MKPFSKRTWYVLVSLLYAATHLGGLAGLPVFADEAIYIRWAQVAYNEPSKYLFLSMLDGKPPLHIWVLMPFVKFFGDPLFGARLLSVLLGYGMFWMMYLLLKEFGLKWKMRMLGAFIVVIVPYWFFHFRMALAEGLVTLLFAVAFYAGIRLMKTGKARYAALFTVVFGASLWTKTNALFFIPVFALLPLFARKRVHLSFHRSIISAYLSGKTLLLVAGGIGAGLLFLLLRLTPLFPFLFTRSADYTFTLQDLGAGEWRYVVFTSLPRVVTWILLYMTPFTLFAALYGKRRNAVLFLMTCAYILPLVLFGKVLTSRYFFPSAVLLTMMSVIGFDALLKAGKRRMFTLLMASCVLTSSIFMFVAITDPAYQPLTTEDKKQYLLDWSSGFGIPEVRDFIRSESSKHPEKDIVVATEGFFGTLPDGLLMYFDGRNQRENVVVYGIGEPITEIPEQLQEEAVEKDVYVVVNRNRFTDENMGRYEILYQYGRPEGAPPLLLLKVKPL